MDEDGMDIAELDDHSDIEFEKSIHGLLLTYPPRAFFFLRVLRMRLSFMTLP